MITEKDEFYTRSITNKVDMRTILGSTRFGNDPLKECCSVYNCVSLRHPEIRLDAPLRYYLYKNPQDAVIGTCAIAYQMAGIPYAWNDSRLTGDQNNFKNDADFVIVTKNSHAKWKVDIEASVKQSEADDGDHFGGFGRLDSTWSSSTWGISDYLETGYYNWPQFDDCNRDKKNPGLDIHYTQQKDNSRETFDEIMHQYSPFYCTRLGHPLFMMKYDGENLKQKIVYTKRPQPKSNEVKIAVPERFAESARSMLMIPRFALFISQSRIMTGANVVVSKETQATLRNAISIHADTLSGKQRSSAKRRLETCIHRGCFYDEVANSPYSGRQMIYPMLGVEDKTEKQIINFLNDLGWIDAVIG